MPIFILLIEQFPIGNRTEETTVSFVEWHTKQRLNVFLIVEYPLKDIYIFLFLHYCHCTFVQISFSICFFNHLASSFIYLFHLFLTSSCSFLYISFNKWSSFIFYASLTFFQFPAFIFYFYNLVIDPKQATSFRLL